MLGDTFEIRRLGPEDISLYRSLRMFALQESPRSFGETPAEESSIALPVLQQRFSQDPHSACVMGAFRVGQAGSLGGIAAYWRCPGAKQRHRAWIWGVFVLPELRRLGLGDRLLRVVIDHSRTVPGLEVLRLSVGAHNTAAQALYLRHGFRRIGTEPKSFLVNGQFVDEESMALDLVDSVQS